MRPGTDGGSIVNAVPEYVEAVDAMKAGKVAGVFPSPAGLKLFIGGRPLNRALRELKDSPDPVDRADFALTAIVAGRLNFERSGRP